MSCVCGMAARGSASICPQHNSDILLEYCSALLHTTLHVACTLHYTLNCSVYHTDHYTEDCNAHCTAHYTEACTAHYIEACTAHCTDHCTAHYTESCTANYIAVCTAHCTEHCTAHFTEAYTAHCTACYTEACSTHCTALGYAKAVWGLGNLYLSGHCAAKSVNCILYPLLYAVTCIL